MNAQVLGIRGGIYSESQSHNLRDFWKGEENGIRALSMIWHLEFKIDKDAGLRNYWIRYGTEEQAVILTSAMLKEGEYLY